MKNVLFGLVLLTGLSISLTSCDDSDDKKDGINDDVNGGSKSIVGTWLLVKEEDKSCDDPTDNDVYVIDCGEIEQECEYYTFDGQGNFMNVDGSDIYDGEYKLSNGKLTLCYDDSAECEEAVSVKRDGANLVVSYDDDDCTVVLTFAPAQ